MRNQNRQSIVAAATAFVGTVVPGQELQSAGLNYEAQKLPNQFMWNGEPRLGVDFQIVRSDTGRSIGCVGKNYHILQNADVFGPVVEMAKEFDAIYDGGGTVFGGESAWMSFRLPFDVAIPNRPEDKFDTNIIVFNNFAGKSNAFISTFTTRWFCMNQMRAIKKHQKGLAEGAEQFVHKIRHNSKGTERLATAHASFKDAIQAAKDTADFMAELDNKTMTLVQMRDFVERLLPQKETSDEPSTQLENARDTLCSLFVRGYGNRGATRYDAMQAVTEWLCHHKTGRSSTLRAKHENRLMSTLVPGGQNDRVAFDAATILSE